MNHKEYFKKLFDNMVSKNMDSLVDSVDGNLLNFSAEDDYDELYKNLSAIESYVSGDIALELLERLLLNYSERRYGDYPLEFRKAMVDESVHNSAGSLVFKLNSLKDKYDVVAKYLEIKDGNK